MKKIYVMEAGERLKIGVAKDVSKRARQLKTGCPQIKVVYESEPLSNAFRIERILHDEYRNAAIGNEWFAGVDKSQVIVQARSAVAAYGLYEEKKADDIDKVSKMMSMLFKDEEEFVQRVEREIKEINCEINELREQMIGAGFSCEEIQEIINKAEQEVENNTKLLTA